MRRSLLALALTVFACRGPAPARTLGDGGEAPASPQASAQPAPLTTLPVAKPPASATPATGDAGHPPEMPRPQANYPPDLGLRDGPGYSLLLALRFPDAPPAARGDVPAGAIDSARRKTEPTFAVDITPTRARVILKGKSFTLPDATEIRMRSDMYGAALVEPGAAIHRVLLPGTLRALFNERRADVGPLTPAELTESTEGARRLGYRTRKVEVWTRAAKATFELGRVQDAGEGGVLLCRFLLDWMSAPPSTPLCGDSEVPLHVELRWTLRGTLVVDAVSILRRLDLPAAGMATPPTTSRFALEPIPRGGATLFLTAPEIAALRPGGETAKLVLLNSTDDARIAWVEGIPFAWVSPGARVEASGFPKAKVSVDWRTFLDDGEKLAPQTITLPGASETGGSDAGGL